MTRILSISLVLPLLSLTLLAGCGGSSSSSSSGDKTAFCQDNAKLDAATASATTPDEALAALKANQSTIDDFAKNAPADIKAQADVLVSTSKAAIAANDSSGLANNAKFSAAGTAVDSYCGQQPNGQPVGSSTGATGTT